MPEIYQTTKAKSNPLLSWLLGGVFTFVVFLLVPVTQFIADATKPVKSFETRQASLPPPEEFEFEEEEIEDEEEEEEPPELEEEPPKLTLDQLELALNPGMGGDLTGDFAMPGFSASESDLNLDDIFDLADLDQQPKKVSGAMPKYPKRLHRRNIEGYVNVLFIVDQNGDVTHIKIAKATHEEFGEAIIKAFKQWKFEPGVKNGQNVRTRMKVRFPFRIKK